MQLRHKCVFQILLWNQQNNHDDEMINSFLQAYSVFPTMTLFNVTIFRLFGELLEFSPLLPYLFTYSLPRVKCVTKPPANNSVRVYPHSLAIQLILHCNALNNNAIWRK